MVLVQKWPCFQLFFLVNIGQKNVFYNILERKNAFLGCKNKKGLTHGFSLKTAIFSTFFFLGNIGQENVFYDILDLKNDFLAYKNKKFKKSKNWHFSKWVNPWFWSKNCHFSNFFFWGNIGQKNVFYDILETKKLLFRLKKRKRGSKSRKIEIFPNGLRHGIFSKMEIFPTFFF